MTFRICHPKNFKDLIEYDKQEGRFNGLLADIATRMLRSFKITQWNVTYEMQANDLGIGAYREDLKRFDGCLGELQLNRTDLVGQMNPYPLDIEDVTQGMIFYETSLVFISAYNKTELGGSAQVTESVDGFTLELWVLCLFTILTLTLVLAIGGRLIRLFRPNASDTEQSNYLYQVLTHCTRLGQMDDGGLRRRLIFLSASVFSLLVVHYFSSMIKTELVVIKDPLVYQSYDDIMKRGAMPLFMKGMGYNSLLSGPSAEPFRKRLWDYAVNNFSERRLYVDLSPMFFLMMSLAVYKQKVIILLDEALMPIVTKSGCMLAKRDLRKLPDMLQMTRDPVQFKNYMKLANIVGQESELITNYTHENDVLVYSEPEVLQHVSRDPQEIPYYQGLVFNSHHPGVHMFIKTCRYIIEHGISLKTMKSFEEVDLFENHPILESMFGPPLASKHSEVTKCLSKSIVKPTLKFQAIKLSNLTSLFKLVGCIYAVLFLVLGAEKIWHSFYSSVTKRRQIVPKTVHRRQWSSLRQMIAHDH